MPAVPRETRLTRHARRRRCPSSTRDARAGAGVSSASFADRRVEAGHAILPGGTQVKPAFASPYAGDRFAAAGRELIDCDLIVMHCMGYDEAMRAKVAQASGRPVLLAQRMLGAAVAQLV